MRWISLINKLFSDIHISQGSVATRLKCGGIFSDCCIANVLEIITVKKNFKIGQYLTKLCVEHLGFTFLAHPVHTWRRADSVMLRSNQNSGRSEFSLRYQNYLESHLMQRRMNFTLSLFSSRRTIGNQNQEQKSTKCCKENADRVQSSLPLRAEEWRWREPVERWQLTGWWGWSCSRGSDVECESRTLRRCTDQDSIHTSPRDGTRVPLHAQRSTALPEQNLILQHGR